MRLIFQRPIVLTTILYALILVAFLNITHFNRGFRPEEKSFLSLKQKLYSSVSDFPKNYGALLMGIVFGDDAFPIDNDTKERYRKAGLSHILVASGAQVSILNGLLLGLFLRFNINRGITFIVISLFNITFSIFAGLGSSIVRASIMGEVSLLALLLSKNYDFYNGLALSSLIIMILDPTAVLDIGFQLTVAATWGLFYFSPIFESFGLHQFFATSLAPIIATVPIILFNFNIINIASLPVNVFVLPWIEVITIFGFFYVLIAQVIKLLFLSASLVFLIDVIEGIVNFFGSFDFLSFHPQSPNIFLLLIYYLLLVYLFEMFKNKLFSKRFKFFALFSFLFAVIFLNSAFSLKPFDGKALQISAIDVGQGDSIFIKTPSGKNYLIDGGRSFGRSRQAIC